MGRQRLLWVILLGLFTGGCGGETPTPAPSSADAVRASAPEKGAEVVIDHFAYTPPELTVSAGTHVTWVNRDDDPHTVTSADRPRHFVSGALDTGERFTHVFRAPGTYAYFCSAHPKMTGRIIVK